MRLSLPFRLLAKKQTLPPLNETEDMIRCSGQAICPVCGFIYEEHPDELNILGYGDVPFLKRICLGYYAKI